MEGMLANNKKAMKKRAIIAAIVVGIILILNLAPFAYQAIMINKCTEMTTATVVGVRQNPLMLGDARYQAKCKYVVNGVTYTEYEIEDHGKYVMAGVSNGMTAKIYYNKDNPKQFYVDTFDYWG